MAVGKTLTVYLAADVDKLRKGLRDADSSLSGFSKNLSGMVGPALIGAAAAAGTFAVAMAVDGVQAAIEEEAELAKLGKTLDNLGFEAQTDAVNSFIDQLQYSAAVSDSTLRPAYSRLLTATNDVTQAQSLLQLALDVSAGTGKSLETVTNALGKAYDGNLGALGKLGAGIDSSTIKSKDLDGALSQLSTTFGGQATVAANTLSGQMKTLGIAFDELKESFGTGFLRGLAGSTGAINDLTTNLRELQPAMDDLGETLGDLGVKLLETAGFLAKADQATKDYGDRLTRDIAIGIIKFGNLLGVVSDAEMDKADADYAAAKSAKINAAATNEQASALITLASIQANMDRYVRGGYSGIPARAMFTDLDTWREKQLALIKPIKQTTNDSRGFQKAVKEMDPALRDQIDLVKDLTSEVESAAQAFDTAQREMNDWIDSMAGKITAGINLGSAFAAQFDDEGKKTGQSLLDGFQKQIDQAGLFGGYLQTLNTEGGPELRDAVAALGPEIGNKLAKQMIDEGLVKTFQDKLVTVQASARRTAESMTPEFLIAGVNSAAAFLFAAQDTLAANAAVLEKMGQDMGRTIGEAAAKEIRDALAAAGIAQTNATNAVTAGVTDATMSAAAAARIAGSPMGFISSMSTNSIAQAISRAISDSDQRLGRSGQAVLQ